MIFCLRNDISLRDKSVLSNFPFRKFPSQIERSRPNNGDRYKTFPEASQLQRKTGF
jgi:hypothetical protein